MKALFLLTIFSLLVGFLSSSPQSALAQEENTPTPTPTPESSSTPESTPTDTPFVADTPTPTLEPSQNSTDTQTPTLESSATATETATSTGSETPTGTLTETPTETPTVTATFDCSIAGYEELCAALAEGPVRVIVELDVDVKTVGQLNNSQEVVQEAKIEDAQEGVELALVDTEAEVVQEYETIPYMAIEVDQEALLELLQSADVESITIDQFHPPALEQSIPLIGADDVWALGFTGAGQTIAILDTGVAKTHPFITSAKVVSEACYSHYDPFWKSTTVCPNGTEAQVGSGAGVNCPLFIDGCNHGTHVAGIAAGKNATFSGVAPDATIISIQVFSRFYNEVCGVETCVLAWDSDIIAGLERVYELSQQGFNIASVNLSLGGGQYFNYCDADNQAMKTAIDNLRSVGIATVIAAGNDGYGAALSFPACISSAISVGASTYTDTIAGFSNRASFLSLLAPGQSINSSVPNYSYASWSGTSMAAPHVAGAWALMKDLNQNLTVSQILGYLQASGVGIQGFKRIQIDAALVLASPRPGKPVLSSPSQALLTNVNTQTFSWGAVALGSTYQIQVDNNNTFVSPERDFTGAVGQISYASAALLDGTYYWRVRGINTYGLPGDWSTTSYLVIDTTPPLAPAIVKPTDLLLNSRGAPLHKWTASTSAVAYQLQYDDSIAFDSINFDTGETTLVQIVPSFAQLGTYYWQLRARDAAGNWSPWTPARSVQIIAPFPLAPVLGSPATNAMTTDNTPDFSWLGVPWGEVYEIQLATNASFSANLQTVTGSAGVLAFTPTSLPDGLYYWHVRSWNVNSPAEPGAWSLTNKLTVDTTAPWAPALSKPLASNIETTSTPRLEWFVSSTALLYQVQVDDDADFSSALVDQTTNATSYVLSAAQALDFETNYWRVRARDAAGNWGDWSPSRNFSVSLMSYPKSGAFTTDSTPLIQWLAGSGATEYNLQVDGNSDFSSPEVDQTLNALKVHLSELDYGLYHWRIRVNTAASGWSSWMLPWTFTITPAPPGASALNLPATALLTNDNTPDLSWQAALNGETYEIQIDNNSNFSSPEQDSVGSASVLNYTATSLIDGTYYWRVRALNIFGYTGAWSASRYFTVDATPPLAPAIVRPLNGYVSLGTPLIQWSKVTGAVQYEFQLDDAPAFDGSEYSGLTNLNMLIPPFYQTGLFNWHVRARDAAGNWSAWSAASTFTINLPLPVAPAQTALAANALTNDNSPDFAWQSVPYGDTYQIQIGTHKNFIAGTVEQDLTTLSGVLTHTADPLAEGLHYWRVRAINNLGGQGAWTAARFFTIDTAAPLAPALTAPVDGFDSRGAALHQWAAASGASYYELQIDDSVLFDSPEYDKNDITVVKFTPVFSSLGSYNWRVRARDAAGNWGPWSAVRILDIIAPLPTKPTLSSPTNGSLTANNAPTFSWLSVPNGNTYQIQISRFSNFSVLEQELTGSSGVLNYPATLLPDGLYYWRVRSFNLNTPAESGAWSIAFSLTIDTTPPAAPSIVKPADNFISVGAPIHQWAKTVGATQYQLQYDEAGEDFGTPVYDSSSIALNSVTPNFTNLGSFAWRVRARDGAGNWGDWTTPRNLTINPPTPAKIVLGVPSNGAATNDNTPTFAWQAVPYAASYDFQVGTSKNFSVIIQQELAIAGLGHTATALPDGVYYWRVRGLNAQNQPGAWSLPFFFTVDTVVPSFPIIVVPVDNLTSRDAPLHKWAVAAGASYYQLQYDDSIAFDSVDYDSGQVAGLTHTPSFSQLGAFYWRLRSRDMAGNLSDWTTPRLVTIIASFTVGPVLSSPVNNFLTNDNTPSFSWQSVTFGFLYQIQIDNNANFSSPERDVTGGAGILTYTSSVLPDGKYYWRVRAINIQSEPGAWSAARSFTMGNYP